MNTDKKAAPGITSKYNITRLVWFEIYAAISREKRTQKMEA